MTEIPAAAKDEVDDFRERVRERMGLRVLGGLVRFIMLFAVAGTFFTSAAMLVYGVVETWHFIAGFFGDHPLRRDDVMLHAIELVDVFLVATVIQVVSIGLYQLYINQRVPLPRWLRIHDIEDLKAKLTGVVITVLGVFFLGEAISYEGGPDLLTLGAAVAAVIGALTLFLISHQRSGEH